jgi:hypothetical protein
VAVDNSGNIYVTGETYSADFPTQNPLQPKRGFNDAFVLKLNFTGSALVYSTYLGGSGGEVGQGIAADAAGYAYVAGYTHSNDFPLHNPLQSTRMGEAEIFVTKFNPTGSALVYSTYLGGSGTDGAFAIALDSAKQVYLTGITASTDFPTQNPLQAVRRCAIGPNCVDAFVTKLNSAGSGLVFSTYLGGSDGIEGYTTWAGGIAADASGHAYTTGQTRSTDFPTTHSLEPFVPTAYHAYATKYAPDGAALVYSVVFGGSGRTSGVDVAVDLYNNAYVAGETSSADFPLVDPVDTTAAEFEAFVLKLNPAGTTILFSTYLGGNKSEFARVALDRAGMFISRGRPTPMISRP